MLGKKKQIWFVSHPSGGLRHTPTFFHAVDNFAREHAAVSVVFPHPAQEDVQLTKEAIESADLVLVEVSISSTGSGIEIGWASAAGKPIYAFYQGGSAPSPALQFATKQIYPYVTEGDIIKILESLL